MEDKFRLALPRIRLLSKEQCKLVHFSTLEVLRRTGVAVKESSAIELFRKAGCFVEGEKVHIPAPLVEWALRNTPKGVCLSDRDGHPALFLEDNNVYFGTGSDTPHVIDPFTGERRRTVLADIANVSKIVDYLDEISFVMCSGIASDVDSDISDIYHFEAMVIHTVKPIVFTAWNCANLKTIIHMAEIVAGGEDRLRNSPFLALYTEPISPLILPRESILKLMVMAEKSLPVVFAPSVTTGGTGPVTLAGGLVQGNAEILAGFVLANLVKEGAPLIYGGSGEPMDMSTTLMSYAAPESMMVVLAYTDMARYYKLPLFGYAGCSDSNLYDQQASLESALWILISALSGGNLVHDVGYINNGLTTSYEQLIVSNEVIGLARRISRGFEVDEESLALDLIHTMGPGGEYLTSRHTLKHFKENWFPDLISRKPYEKWEREGSKTLGRRANERVRFIIENHRPQPLEESIRKELKKSVQSLD